MPQFHLKLRTGGRVPLLSVSGDVPHDALPCSPSCGACEPHDERCNTVCCLVTVVCRI